MTDQLREQAALYAIGALPPDEAHAFREELATDPELQSLVAEYEDAAADLCNLAEPTPASPGLRERILREVRPTPSAVERERPPAWLGTIPWALAACLAIAAVAAAFFAMILDRRWGAAEMELGEARLENNSLTRELAATHASNQQLVAQLEQARQETELARVRVETLTSKLDQSYLAAIAWDEYDKKGILHVRKLPPAEPGKNYQLWVIDPDQPAPVSAGVFTVEPDGSARIEFKPIKQVGKADTFAVSLEEAGGVESPAGPVLLQN